VALAADGRQQVTLDLVAGAGLEDVAGPRDEHLERVRGPAEFPLHEGRADRVETAAAELGRHVRGVEAGLEGLGPDVGGHLVRDRVESLDLALVRVQLRLDEAAHRFDDQPLLGAEGEVHWLSPDVRQPVAVFP
jgi:hypothetical protein